MGFLRRLRGGGDRGVGSGEERHATRFSQFGAECEIRCGPDHTVVDYSTDAICPDAEAFSEILMFCHLAIHGLKWTSRPNRAASALALSRGTDLAAEASDRGRSSPLRVLTIAGVAEPGKPGSADLVREMRCRPSGGNGCAIKPMLR